MKQEVELDELKSARVSWISLVDAGAARTPFKIQKAEEPGGGAMLNFNTIFKDAPFESRVLAVAVAPDVDETAVKDVIEKAGLKAETRKEIDGAAVYEQGEGALDSGTGRLVTVKLNEKIAVVCDVAKSFSPFTGSPDFNENLKSLGFLPSFELSLDALRTSTFESLQKAETRGDAAKMVTQAATDFAKHLSAMVGQLPEEVFKLEEVVKATENPALGGNLVNDPAGANEFSTKGNPDQTTNPDSAANTGADRTAGEEGTTGLAKAAKAKAGKKDGDAAEGEEKENPFAKFAKKKKVARKAAFETMGLSEEVINAIELIVEKQGGIAPSGVASGEASGGSPGAPEVDGKSDQEDGGLVGPTGKATVDSAGSSHPEGTGLDPTGVTKDELAEALAAALAPFADLKKKVDAMGEQIETGIQKAEDAGRKAARGIVLGEPEGDDGEGIEAEVRYSEPPLIDTGLERLQMGA